MLLPQHLVRFPDRLAPEIISRHQGRVTVFDIQVHRAGRLTFDDDHVPAREFELSAKETARV